MVYFTTYLRLLQQTGIYLQARDKDPNTVAKQGSSATRFLHSNSSSATSKLCDPNCVTHFLNLSVYHFLPYKIKNYNTHLVVLTNTKGLHTSKVLRRVPGKQLSIQKVLVIIALPDF